MTIYEREGYESRKDYLNSLAADLGVSRKAVYEMASLLGSNEDFDGLVTMLQDYAEAGVI